MSFTADNDIKVNPGHGYPKPWQDGSVYRIPQL